MRTRKHYRNFKGDHLARLDRPKSDNWIGQTSLKNLLNFDLELEVSRGITQCTLTRDSNPCHSH